MNTLLGDVEFLSDATWGSDDELNVESGEDPLGGNQGDDRKRVVLHPTQSAYAARYPDFDTFAGEPLIDNGYVDGNNNQCRAMIVHSGLKFDQDHTSIDYYNTLFTVNGNNSEE